MVRWHHQLNGYEFEQTPGDEERQGSLSLVQFSRSIVFDSLPPPECQASLSSTNSQSPPKPMSIESVRPSNHLILCCPLLLLPSIFPSIRVFSDESVLCIRWPKYWSFSFNISPSNAYLGLISFRMDWLDLLAVQGTLKSLLQQHSSKASIFQHSAFFIVQLSHSYMTTGKTTALTRWTFERKVMSLFSNMLSRLVMASGPITSWQIDGETVETVSDFIFLGSKITADGDCSHELKDTCSLEKKL